MEMVAYLLISGWNRWVGLGGLEVGIVVEQTLGQLLEARHLLVESIQVL